MASVNTVAQKYTVHKSDIKTGTSEDRGAARQTDGRSPPSTHVLVAFRMNAPLSSLDP